MKAVQELFEKILADIEQFKAFKAVDSAAGKNTSYSQGGIDALSAIANTLVYNFGCKAPEAKGE